MLYPVSLNLKGKKCIIFGAGKIALRRAKRLTDCGAYVTAAAPEKCPDGFENITYIRELYRPELIDGYFMVFACTDSERTNAQIVCDSQKKGILVSSATADCISDFSVPASRTCKDVTISADTGGKAPSLSAMICRELEKDIEIYGELCTYIGKYRDRLRRTVPDKSHRMKIMKMLASEKALSVFRNGGAEAYRQYADKISRCEIIPVKKAVISVSIGSADEITENLKKAYPECDVFHTSNLPEMLDDLKQKGYTHVYCLPLYIIAGVEYSSLCRDISAYENSFDCLRCAMPLLSESRDYMELVSAIDDSRIISSSDETAYILAGHGTSHHSNCAYPALDYYFKQTGHNNVFVGTISGYPDRETVLQQLEKHHFRKAVFIPLMTGAGRHFRKDVAGTDGDSWKSFFERNGLETDAYMHGLAQCQAVQDIFFRHLKEIYDAG